jgi:U4/U6.U5 tri-snRNP-associated protein 1
MRGISLRPRVFEEEFKSKNQIGADIKLEYFDDFGNQLTSKEAYKELSRRFHGKKAGKSRIEKAIMKREQTNRIEKANATGSVIVSNLRKQQAEAASPYVVLSSTRAQDAASSAAVSTAPSEPVKQRKIFGLQVKQ